MKRSGLLGLALFLSVAFATSGPLRAQDADRFFAFGSGGVKGIYFPIAAEICRSVNAHAFAHGYRCGIVATNGTVENYEGLKDGKLTFAIVQSNAMAARSVRPPDLATIAALHPEPLHVAVRASSEIRFLTDLTHRSVNVGVPQSGTRQIALALIEVAALDIALDRRLALGPNTQAQRLCDGTVDALFWVSGLGNPSMAEAHRRCPVRLLEIPADMVDAIFTRVPGLSPMTIPAGTYRNQEDAVATFGPVARVVTRADTPGDLVRLLADAIAGDYGDIRRTLPALADLSDADLARLVPNEVHHADALTAAVR
ncbi:TAXI family TRAP transporter solute-binding subunit [Phaeobacter inhibens]|uniref:TAXI family TRAP transporter solute-binding subunit n=1 Tax=Phaeobacter inhibens TaxID=221822 RepID=UPI0021A88BFD|nr:TAXI family TRAP transporter solute-binding subunit [Phaeobacter inhibens]UWR91703.1 TAXI family TRAP transporter solute-binding subunit [Phaeobacter inhibens]